MKYERQARSFMAVRRILFTETELSAAPVVNNASGVRVDFSFLGTEALRPTLVVREQPT